MSHCQRCEQSPTFCGALRTCAFPEGVFSAENWNCATMNALRELVEDEQGLLFARNGDDRIGLIALPEHYEEGVQSGYLVLTWYKERGRTGQAVVLSDEEQELLTLATAEWILAQKAGRR